MKRILAILLALLTLPSMASAEGGEALPAFVYQGDAPYVAQICDWLLAEEAELYMEGDVAIPSPVILETDDTDPGDIRVWGNFSLYWYELRGTTLFAVSGGELPGCFHLRREGDGCAVVSLDRAEDGDGYEESLERIFGVREGLLEKLLDSDAADGDAALQFVADYVRWNGLHITQRQDFGWAPQALPGAPETTEAEQRIRYESPMGYCLDYDLRELSLDQYDDTAESFSGVEALEGASLDVELRGEDMESVAAALEADMAEPAREAAAIGADGLEAIRVYDAGLRDVDRSHYLLAAADGGTLVLTSSNAYYASDVQAVTGADAVLEKVLGSFCWVVSQD